jgi:hypothetical protein
MPVVRALLLALTQAVHLFSRPQVLCQQCRLPECELLASSAVDDGGEPAISFRCSACGHCAAQKAGVLSKQASSHGPESHSRAALFIMLYGWMIANEIYRVV